MALLGCFQRRQSPGKQEKAELSQKVVNETLFCFPFSCRRNFEREKNFHI